MHSPNVTESKYVAFMSSVSLDAYENISEILLEMKAWCHTVWSGILRIIFLMDVNLELNSFITMFMRSESPF
jgi:hypothetical protein